MRLIIVFLFFFMTLFSLIGQHNLQGVVTNEKGEKLSFATVYLLDSPYAASTDEKGNFYIKNIHGGSYTLKATFIGYKAYIKPLTISGDLIFDITLAGEIYNLDQVEIQANRVGDNGPFTYQNLQKDILKKENLGQDVPFILQWTPSMVVTSDGGTGIGYTGLRLRGSDQTRINVTINGVPLNDAESQNVFWVDLPDLMGSVNNVQIQRGVGTSTNGSGAFGGTVSINTANVRVNPYIDLAGTLGAFRTGKLNISLGTGLINNRYIVDGRYSVIKSDGYVDRASANLNSIAFSAARVTDRSSIRLNVLSGMEETYQAWYGVPQAKLAEDSVRLLNHYYNNIGGIYKSEADSVNLFSSDRRYNYYTYPGQVDNYRQTHVQLIHALSVHSGLKTKMTLFYTKGKGYFEEFKHDDKLANYGIPAFPDDAGSVVSNSDIIRRRWLDNDLIGLLGDAEYKLLPDLTSQAGLAVNYYNGLHFGNVLRSEPPIPDLDKSRRYYENTGKKSDIAAYFRVIYKAGPIWTIHGDMQVRRVGYNVKGNDNDLRDIELTYDALFFNPKIGASMALKANQQIYISYALANKEPSRGDFIDNAFNLQPKSENLHNLELGFRTSTITTKVESNLYYMSYRDQLVLTGELNDVGAPVRINVPESYRLGWEGNLTHHLNSKFSVHANLTLSANKIKNFDEIIADYTVDFEKVVVSHEDTDISFSPTTIGTIQLLFKPFKYFEAELSSKYVGKQFLDNTSDISRSLPAYHYQNLRLSLNPLIRFSRNLTLTIMINNLFDIKYSSNGYTYSYIYGELITENFLYPQAGRHLMIGMNASF